MTKRKSRKAHYQKMSRTCKQIDMLINNSEDEIDMHRIKLKALESEIKEQEKKI